MKVNYDKAIQVINELKVNVNEQCDIDDEDKVWKTTVTRTP